jgi:hypothetical protein
MKGYDFYIPNHFPYTEYVLIRLHMFACKRPALVYPTFRETPDEMLFERNTGQPNKTLVSPQNNSRVYRRVLQNRVDET